MADVLRAAWQWTNSKLYTLQQCGEKFRRSYLEQDYRGTTTRALRGSLIHRVGGDALLSKLRKLGLPSVEWARDTAATLFEAQWKGSEIRLDDDESEEGVKSVRAATKDFVVAACGYHVGEIAPVIVPVAVERKITVRPKDSDLVIAATLDLVERDADGEIVCDLKTAEKAPYKARADRSQQLTFQAMVRHAETKAFPRRQRLDVLVRTPALKELKYYPLPTTRDESDVRALVARINHAVEAVKRGVFTPANEDAWWCSKQWCEYYDSCPYVGRKSRPTE